jgi:hypothetical protein
LKNRLVNDESEKLVPITAHAKNGRRGSLPDGCHSAPAGVPPGVTRDLRMASTYSLSFAAVFEKLAPVRAGRLRWRLQRRRPAATGLKIRT